MVRKFMLLCVPLFGSFVAAPGVGCFLHVTHSTNAIMTSIYLGAPLLHPVSSIVHAVLRIGMAKHMFGTSKSVPL